MPQQVSEPAPLTMPREHEHDSLAVTNIDIGCEEKTTYTIEKSVPVPPIPGENNPMNIPRYQTQQVEGEFDHSEYFEVRYNGQPFRIEPGETKVFPRYIAEHYAKHLADHILQKKEETENRQGLVQSKIERPKVLDQILEVRQWFLEGQKVEQSPLSADTPGILTQDLGNIPNYALGDLKPEPKTAEEILNETVSPGPTVEAPGIGARVAKPAVIDNVPPEPPTTQASETAGRDLGSEPIGTPQVNETPLEQPDLPQERSKSDLIREAVQLGIEVSGREKVDDLKKKIAAF